MMGPGAGGASRRVMQVAVALAVLLHVLLALALLIRPPAFLARLAHVAQMPQAPPRQAEVELVQNDMPATGDAALGGTGKENASSQQAQKAAPARPPAMRAARATAPQASPAMPVGPGGIAPPPQPKTAALPPGPVQPAQKDQPQPQQAQEAQQDQFAVRLSDQDTTEGLSGGSAETPAAPDPKAHNRLPAYPVEAGTRGEHGAVQAIVNVKADGTAAAVVVVRSSGYPDLDSTAVRTWQTWRFRPAMENGKAVPSQVPVQLNFVLRP
jgi:protein TonB